MSRQEQKELRREALDLCPQCYTGEYRLFLNAQCKVRVGHEGDHRTWRKNDSGEILMLQWPRPVWGGDRNGVLGARRSPGIQAFETDDDE